MCCKGEQETRASGYRGSDVVDVDAMGSLYYPRDLVDSCTAHPQRATDSGKSASSFSSSTCSSHLCPLSRRIWLAAFTDTMVTINELIRAAVDGELQRFYEVLVRAVCSLFFRRCC